MICAILRKNDHFFSVIIPVDSISQFGNFFLSPLFEEAYAQIITDCLGINNGTLWMAFIPPDNSLINIIGTHFRD